MYVSKFNQLHCVIARTGDAVQGYGWVRGLCEGELS